MPDHPRAPGATDWGDVALTLACVATLPLLVTWPLPRVFSTQVLAAPDQEAATHIWGLWLALKEGLGAPIHSNLVSWPDGGTLVLIDPANLPWYAIGQLVSPAAGYNLCLLVGVVLAGIAGAELAREAGGPRWLGAVAGLSCPPLLAGAADGTTEGFGVGLVGLQFAWMLRWARSGRWPVGLAATLALAACPLAGPYNGVWAALLNLGWVVTVLARRQRDWRAVTARATAAGLAALALAAPQLAALTTARTAQLPGGSSRGGLPPAREFLEIFRGGVQTGADLLDPWLPAQLTGGVADVSHTTYLGCVALLAGVLAVYKAPRRRWPWLLGVAAFAAIALGPILYVAGSAVDWMGTPTLTPVGWGILALPALGRITRWYRAAAVARLLLGALAAVAVRRPSHRVALAAALVLDTILLAPMAWPLHATPPPDGAALAALPGEGALLELPPVTSGTPPPGLWRDHTGIMQVQHGRPIAGGVMGMPLSQPARAALDDLRGAARRGHFPDQDRARIYDRGFEWLVVYPRHHALPPRAFTTFQTALGPPILHTDDAVVFDLRGPTTP